MWEDSLDDYSWINDVVKMCEDPLGHKQIYYDKFGHQLAVVDKYKLARLADVPIATWHNNASNVKPPAIEVTYTDLANAGLTTQEFMNSLQLMNSSLLTYETETEKIIGQEPEHTILVYQSEPIGKYGIVLILEGTNPEYEEWVEKQLEKGE